MKVLITGAGGQLGQELQSSAPEHIEIVALGHVELDVSSAEAVAGVGSGRRIRGQRIRGP
jgi:dTDP-4-dehydrorhamnose reductase